MAGRDGVSVFLLLRTIALLSLSLFRPAAVNSFRSLSRLNSLHQTPRCSTYVITAMSRKRAATEGTPSLKNVVNKESILYEWTCHNDASFHDFTPEEASEIRQSLLDWYRSNRRKLPWRGDAPPYDGSTAGVNSNNKSKKQKEDKNQPSIRNFFAATKQQESGASAEASNDEENQSESSGEAPPSVTAYGVWVSEIMLQQTRVEAVIPFYLKWMKKFPTVHDLANASEEEVNAHWAGLGFYRRARLLHKGAKKVVEQFDGQLPQTVDGLLEIDGIGRYTASAIASIAFDVTVPVVDGNVCRVLSRLRGIANHIKAPILKDDLGWKLAEQIVSAGDGRHSCEVNQALMELGATYCAPSGTGTDDRDPLKKFYMSPQVGVAFMEEKNRLADAGYDSFPVDEYIEEAMTLHEQESVCKLCDGEGVRTILNDLSIAAESLNGSSTRAAQIGHSVFPTAPPKKAKREEVLAVAALSYTASKQSVERWLLVRRPADGLLAGQWEFPSVCVWTSESLKMSGKNKQNNVAVDVPTIDAVERVKALNGLLENFSSCSEGAAAHDWLEECDRIEVGAKPIEHIFSHVRHTMWIEHGDGSKHVDSSYPNEWSSPEGKELRWMSEEEMKEVGVTAGVMKILKAVKLQRQESKRPAKKSKRKVK